MKGRTYKKIRRNFFLRKKNITFGQIHILSSLNNTIVTITDKFGKTISWLTARASSNKKFKKSSIYSSQKVAELASRSAYKIGMRFADVIIKGPGSGRDASLRGVCNSGVKIMSISDVTTIPHNGCKARKMKRK